LRQLPGRQPIRYHFRLLVLVAFVDILPALSLRSQPSWKDGDSYGARRLSPRRRFGGFLLLTA